MSVAEPTAGLRRRTLVLWGATLAVLQVVLVTLPGWIRVGRYCGSNFDLGIYSQALAHLSWSNPNPWLSGRQVFVFNDHFDPILALVAPFTRLAPAVRVGPFFEGLFAILSLLPLAWLGRAGRLSSSGLWTLGLLMTLHLGVTQALGYSFHPTTWAMLPMAVLGAALLLDRPVIAGVALVALLACKEEFPFAGLMLGLGLLWLTPRKRLAWCFIALSAAWGLWDFVVRPEVLGQTIPYATQPFRGAEGGVLAFLSARLTPGALAGMGDFVVPLVPLGAWLILTRREGSGDRRSRVIALALVPMLAIRFLSTAWRDQYGAVVVSCLALCFAAILGTRKLPWWVLGGTVLAVVLTNLVLFTRTFHDYFGPTSAQSVACPALPGRVDAVDRAVSLARAARGPLLVGGNLLPWLAERDDVYQLDGPAPVNLVPATLVMEKPPRGDRWAVSDARNAELLEQARAKARRLVIDDEFVFMAELADAGQP